MAKFAKPPDWGGRQNRFTQLQCQGNLRGKRSDPSREVNVLGDREPPLSKTVVTRSVVICRRVNTMSGEQASADVYRTGLRGLTR